MCPHSLDGFLNECDFIDRVDIYRINPCPYRFIQLVIAFARAIEDNLTCMKANAQRLEEFASAIDFDVDAGFEHGFEYSHVRVCFRGIEEANRAVHSLCGLLEPIYIRAYAWLGKNKEGRIVLTNQRQRVSAADTEVTITYLEIGGNRPRRSLATTGDD